MSSIRNINTKDQGELVSSDTEKGQMRPKSSFLHLKYTCRYCGKYSKKSLHPSNFQSSCKKCHSRSHLIKLNSSFRILYGGYRCQNSRCDFKWTQKLSFKSVILNTPLCKGCNKLSKITMMIYKNIRISFKNSTLYKCEKCFKCISVPAVETVVQGDAAHANPNCKDCGVSMIFLKNVKSLFYNRLGEKKLIKENRGIDKDSPNNSIKSRQTPPHQHSSKNSLPRNKSRGRNFDEERKPHIYGRYKNKFNGEFKPRDGLKNPRINYIPRTMIERRRGGIDIPRKIQNL
jgi:hypothetical protein